MINGSQTAGWQKYSHEQFGLPAWGASGPYLKVYEKFGITGSSEYIFDPLHDSLVHDVLSRHCRGGQEGCRVLQTKRRPCCFAPGEGYYLVDLGLYPGRIT